MISTPPVLNGSELVLSVNDIANTPTLSPCIAALISSVYDTIFLPKITKKNKISSANLAFVTNNFLFFYTALPMSLKIILAQKRGFGIEIEKLIYEDLQQSSLLTLELLEGIVYHYVQFISCNANQTIPFDPSRLDFEFSFLSKDLCSEYLKLISLTDDARIKFSTEEYNDLIKALNKLLKIFSDLLFTQADMLEAE